MCTLHILLRFEQTLPPSAIGRDIPVSAKRLRQAASPSHTVATGGGLDSGLVDAPYVRQVRRVLLQ